jgi:localization factor PodJL
MKSGGLWNLRGPRSEAREAADNAARRAGMSVGEWLNDLIEQSDSSNGGPMRQTDCEKVGDGRVGWPDAPPEPNDTAANGSQRPRRHDGKYERENVLAREASLAREEFDDVHSRLDKLTSQLDRMARGAAPHLGAERSGRPQPAGLLSCPANASAVAETPIDLNTLEQQLRHITNQIESLHPPHDFEKLIAAFRADLLEISRQITEALPRQAVDSLGLQVDALAKQINHSRQSGVDSSVLAAIEGGLTEVRDALRRLTTAESLIGFDESVKALAQKVDLIVVRQDPTALEQLQTAIGALRGIVSHVASGDALDKVAEDARALAVKVDALANSAASGHAVSALASRIDTLASAVHASAEVGHAVPRELEKLLTALVEKLDRGRLAQTDHATLHRLEDRITLLIKRFDASDARLGNLESIERGLADLLAHIDRSRGEPATVDAIARDVAEIRRSEQRTQDSLKAVHGAVEQLVDRLAMIERDIRDASAPVQSRSQSTGHRASETAAKPAAGLTAIEAALTPTDASAKPAVADVVAGRIEIRRPPIDPNLPPDHPLEPGSAIGSGPASAAERIAAFELSIGAARPAIPGEASDKQDFIAAARRAAQAAAAPVALEPRSESRRRKSFRPTAGNSETRPSRARKLLVAGSVALVTVVCLESALHLFQDNRLATETPAVPDRLSPPAAPPETGSSTAAPTTAAPTDTVPAARPNKPENSRADTPANPDHDVPPPPALPQSPVPAPAPTSALVKPASSPGLALGPAPTPAPTPAPIPAPTLAPASAATAPAPQPTVHGPTETTGSLPTRMPPPALAIPISTAAPPPSPLSAAPEASAPDAVVDKLPVTIGGPTLRAAAMAGDTAAEFEVAMRFAQGRGISPDQQQAAHWLELAAQQGLAPAQFRLGGFYEKGIGVKKDLAEARTLYMAAAAKGNAKAMHNLAVLYAEGINGPSDYRTAAQWFRKAAERGITDSQYNLGILYERGSGEQQNYAEAYKWFALAAEQGDSEAAIKRDEIASELDQQTLEAADLAVKSWKPEPQPDDAANVKTPAGGWDATERIARAKVPLPVAKPLTLEPKIK